jgi:hypothetical protein
MEWKVEVKVVGADAAAPPPPKANNLLGDLNSTLVAEGVTSASFLIITNT